MNLLRAPFRRVAPRAADRHVSPTAPSPRRGSAFGERADGESTHAKRGGLLLCAGLLGSLFVAGCNLGNGSVSPPQGDVGSEQNKPDGSGTFFVDPNSGGRASRFRIEDVLYGRLVNVFALDPVSGDAEATPRFTDFAINENIVSDGVNYRMETNPATQATRLVVLRTKDDPEFTPLLLAAEAGQPEVVAKNDDGTSSEPFSLVARNACIVIRTNDLIQDDPAAVLNLLQNVQVLQSYPPSIPYEARILFDPNHGGITGGAFHSTRVLVDLTISELEAADLGGTVTPNLIGLPASLQTSGQPNASLHIPTKQDFTTGQFTVLANLRGNSLDIGSNGPADLGSPTLDVVRAFRSGNSLDPNNGFLFDDQPPEIVGGWNLNVDAAGADTTGTTGFDFILDLTFSTACQAAPKRGDLLELATGQFLEVTEDGTPPDMSGSVANVRARILTSSPVSNLTLLVGGGLLRTPYDPNAAVDPACWVSFLPGVSAYPPADVQPSSQIVVRFSEPMDPDTVGAFDTLQVFNSGGSSNPAVNTVVGSLVPSPDSRDFSFTPVLPFAHSGDSRTYDLILDSSSTGVMDLAGNPLLQGIPTVSFSIDPTAAQSENGSVVLRFDSLDEYREGNASGFPDIRGQIGVFDTDRGIIQARPVTRASYAVDTANPGTLPAAYIPIPFGVQTPLNPLGSKLQAVWRYMDFGFTLVDETKHDLDIEGIDWAPNVVPLIADVYDRFEMRLSHSVRLPDLTFMVAMGTVFISHTSSGLLDNPNMFDQNILGGPSKQVTVHSRGLGYVVDPSKTFAGVTGTTLAPYPLNRVGGPHVTYTWRDTSILDRGGADSGGVPTGPDLANGSYPSPLPYSYGPGDVPTIGLPLLMEFRCFPADDGLGLNTLSVAYATPVAGQIPASPGSPKFRVFSSGGTDQLGNIVKRDPDLQSVPMGGFNPLSTPPGLPTPSGDPLIYLGQIDTVIRVNRMDTIWFTPTLVAPNYASPIIEPDQDAQPVGTSVLVEYRGASSFSATNDEEVDASMIDPYGDPRDGSVSYYLGVEDWSSNINTIDGAPFFQVRLSFFNNITSGQSPELSTIAVPYGQ